jgi:hypothetical protein
MQPGTAERVRALKTAGLDVPQIAASVGLEIGDVATLIGTFSMGADATAPVAPTAYSEGVLSDSPTSYWRLGESSGPVAHDFHGANDGTFVGSPTHSAGLVAGDSNGAVTLNGTSQNVLVPDANSLDFTTGLTLEALIKPADTSSEHHIVGKNHYNLICPGANVRLELELNDGTNFNRYQAFSAGASLAAGQVFHVAGVYDKSAAAMLVYINGAVSGTPVSVPPGRNITVNTDPLTIGCNYNGTEFFYHGVIDEVAVYPKALSAAQIARHAQTAGIRL